MQAKWRAFALVEMLVNKTVKILTRRTGYARSLLLVFYSILVRVGVGIQHSLPFRRPWTSGLRGICRSTL